MHFLLTRSCCVPWTAAEETYPVPAELVAFILSLWGGMNYCVIVWLMTTNDLWFMFGISLGELSAVSRGHSSSAVPGLSTILAHPPFLDVDRGWWCALFTQQWREKPYFLLYTLVSFLPFFKWDVCREKAPDGGAPLFQPRPVLVCKVLDPTPHWSWLGGAHTLVHTCTSSLRNVQWCESGGRGQGRSHFLLVLLRETCVLSQVLPPFESWRQSWTEISCSNEWLFFPVTW